MPTLKPSVLGDVDKAIGRSLSDYNDDIDEETSMKDARAFLEALPDELRKLATFLWPIHRRSAMKLKSLADHLDQPR